MDLLIISVVPLVFLLLLILWLSVAESKLTLLIIALAYSVLCVIVPITYGWITIGGAANDPGEAVAVACIVLGMRLFDVFAFKVPYTFREKWRDLSSEELKRRFDEWTDKLH